MKKVFVVASAAFIVNILAGLLISFYPLVNMLFTSLAIIINTLLVGLLFIFNAESTHRLSLGIVFCCIGLLEYVAGLFAPDCLMNNWWLIAMLVLTALQAVLVYLAIHYANKK